MIILFQKPLLMAWSMEKQSCQKPLPKLLKFILKAVEQKVLTMCILSLKQNHGLCFGTPKPCVDCKEKCVLDSSHISLIPRLAPTPIHVTCTTKDGRKCQFPFIYQGEKYEACPQDPEDPNENWCSTRTDADGEHVGGGGHYGFCGDSCPTI